MYENKLGGGKIQSVDEWLEILHVFKSGRCRCETNCYISLPQLEEYIDEGRLRYEIASDTTLWLFERERDYYLGYYYVSKEDSLCIRPQDLDLVIYLIGNEKKYAQHREKELLQLGCLRYRKNLEYLIGFEKEAELEMMNRKCLWLMKKMGFQYTRFHRADYESVYQLWRERIDRYSVKDMLQSRIRQMEQNEECMIIRDKENNIIAACDFEINGTVAYSENIATVISGGGIGAGGVLFSGSLLNIFSRGCRKDCTWVWEDNTESRKMTERFGILTGKFSQQLLLEKQSDIDETV